MRLQADASIAWRLTLPVILVCLFLSYSLSSSGQGPSLWWFIFCEAIYSSVNNYVWSSQDTLIGFYHEKKNKVL